MKLPDRTLRILVVDPSANVRLSVKLILEQIPTVAVVDTARDGPSALEKIERYDPHLVTLDVDMPGMNGLDLLEIIMDKWPRPVVILSAQTKQGAALSIQALRMGAVDVIAKNRSGLVGGAESIEQELTDKVVAVAEAYVIKHSELYALSDGHMRNRPEEILPRSAPDLVVIGASTGGTEGIRLILASLPQDFPMGILVVQHMPRGFTRTFAEFLNSQCALEVREARDKDLVKPGRVLIAPGGAHMFFQQDSGGRYVRIAEKEPVNGHQPSVDVLFDSVARAGGGSRALAILLSGMGRDGAEGMREIARAGGFNVAQDEQSSVVFGMPKAAIELGVVQRVSPLARIPSLVKKSVKQLRSSAGADAPYAEKVAT